MPLQSTPVFERMQAAVEVAGEEIVKKARAVIKFVIKEDPVNGTWILDFKNGDGKVYQGQGKADVTFTMSDSDFVAMSEGKLDGQSAFMGGKLKLAGNMAIAMKLGGILDKLKEIGETAGGAGG